ncbi:MAG: hypothetical protein MZW92_30365 [Comamonadaceae bacterium]|nr:hypothetical protein [Comamonadaceae bacterium]
MLTARRPERAAAHRAQPLPALRAGAPPAAARRSAWLAAQGVADARGAAGRRAAAARWTRWRWPQTASTPRPGRALPAAVAAGQAAALAGWPVPRARRRAAEALPRRAGARRRRARRATSRPAACRRPPRLAGAGGLVARAAARRAPRRAPLARRRCWSTRSSAQGRGAGAASRCAAARPGASIHWHA